MYVRASGKPMFDANGEFRGYRGTGTDVTALRTVEAEARENERRYREAQLELAHANRVATMGQLTASIAHEVNQPITAAVTNAQAALRWMSAKPPDFSEVSEALAGIIKEGNRASEVIGRIRALIKKAPPRKDAVSINDAILEVVALTRTEAANNGVLVRTQLAEGLPPVQGDRVQLQQVLLNLIINAIEAMRDVGEEERQLFISTRNEPDGVSVEVRGFRSGLDAGDSRSPVQRFLHDETGRFGAWDCRSADRLSKRITDDCGPVRTFHVALSFASSRLPIRAAHREWLPARDPLCHKSGGQRDVTLQHGATTGDATLSARRQRDLDTGFVGISCNWSAMRVKSGKDDACILRITWPR